MTRTEIVLETLVYSPFNHLTDAAASPRIFYWMHLKYIVRKIIRFPYLYTYKSFTTGLGEKKKTQAFWTFSPRVSFHLISFFETTSAKQIDDGGGGVTWCNIVKLSGMSDSRFAPLLIAHAKVDHYER